MSAEPVDTPQGDWTTGAEAVLYELCPACGHLSYFRREFCPACGTSPVTVLASAGTGTVYAATVVVRAPSPDWKALAPYPILLVDLDEGIRMMAHGATGLRIGDRVRIGWHRVDDAVAARRGALNHDSIDDIHNRHHDAHFRYIRYIRSIRPGAALCQPPALDRHRRCL